jgi:hypothetical protein
VGAYAGLEPSDPEVSANFDDLKRLIEEDELKDRAEVTKKMPPRDYARARGIRNPQSVYYHIRAGHFKQVKCDCGRWVIDVEEADIFYGFKKVNLTEEGDGE